MKGSSAAESISSAMTSDTDVTWTATAYDVTGGTGGDIDIMTLMELNMP